MKILVLSNGSLIEKDIPNELAALQREVGGYIETVPSVDPFAERKIITLVNEDGLYLPGLAPQLVIAHEIYIVNVLLGNVVFVGFDGREDFCGLNDEQIEFVRNTLCKKISYKGQMVYVIDLKEA